MPSLVQTNQLRNRRPLITILLPLCLFSLMGAPVELFVSFLTANTRWLIFGVLVLFILANNKIFNLIGNQLAVVLFAYLGWCFMTSFWSDVPILSFSKSSLLIFVVLTMVFAGIEWVKTHPWEKALDPIGVIAFIALLSGFLGEYYVSRNISYIEYGEVILFQGLVRGPNMFGLLLAASFPFLLWKTYSSWKNKKIFITYLIMTVYCIHFLIMTVSRASIMAMLVTLAGFIFSLNLSKKIAILLSIMIIGMGWMTVNPESIVKVTESAKRYIFKTDINQTDILYSRMAVWGTSIDSAMAGGLTGIGYSASNGFTDFSFNGRLTTIMYGREKGNSQLAIIEETGWIGLALYLIVIMTISFKLLKMYISTKDRHQKVLIGITSGIFGGMIVQSIFEAWWDASGSQECTYFWLLVGIIRGLEIILQNKRAPHVKFGMET